MNVMRSYLYERQNGYCHYCNIKMTKKATGLYFCTMDHKLPRSKGGGDLPGNLVGACFTCNNMRGSIEYTAFKMFVGLYGNRVTIKRVWQDLTQHQRDSQTDMWSAIAVARPDIVYVKPAPVKLTVVAPVEKPYRRAFLHITRRGLEDIVVKFSYNEKQKLYREGLSHEEDPQDNRGIQDTAGGNRFGFLRGWYGRSLDPVIEPTDHRSEHVADLDLPSFEQG